MGQTVLSQKTIAVVTGSESTKHRILHQLEKLLEGCANIVGYALDEGLPQSIEGELIVYSSQSLIDESAAYVQGSPTHLLARRAIDTSHLDQLFILPRGSQVLLVNDSKESTDESIELLNLLGFDAVTWWPYYPQMPEADRQQNAQRCHLAVTLGERGLVPESMLQVVDLGPRIIDLSTIVEILHHLDLLNEKGQYISATYFATVVKMGKTIHRAMDEQEKLNERLGNVLHQINDGILAYDQNGVIQVFSQRCEVIFNTRSERAIGKPITQVIKDDQLIQLLKNGEGASDAILKLGSDTFAINRFTSGHTDWHVCIFKSLSDVAALESKRRQQLLQKGHVAKYGFKEIVYTSDVMAEVIHTAKRIARTKLAVLIYGESGTGKELFASAIHQESLVHEGPFLAVNFSALPEELVESELFGYEEGAFTGAKKGGKMGLFEQANGGTLFLDEIGDISLKIQARLLRVLQEKEIMRVGGTEIIPIDVRIIAATNKPLLDMCREGTFREDLYYRLKRLYIETPPLRKRRKDIVPLVHHFLDKNNATHYTLSEELLEALQKGTWKGNVRELESVVEYLVAVSEDTHLTLNELPADVYEEVNGELNGENELNWGYESDHINPNNSLASKGFSKGPQGLSQDLEGLLMLIFQGLRQGESLGRDRLASLSQVTSRPMTSEQIRGRVKKLEGLGYVVVYKGRTGIQLTDQGSRYCLSQADKFEL